MQLQDSSMVRKVFTKTSETMIVPRLTGRNPYVILATEKLSEVLNYPLMKIIIRETKKNNWRLAIRGSFVKFWEYVQYY